MIKDWVTDYKDRFRSITVVSRRPPKHYPIQEANKTPVVLLPGISLKWQFMRRLGDKISLAGHPVHVIPNLKRNYKDIPRSAQIVNETIQEYGLKKVVIIGHSKGGLIGKYLLVHHNSDKRIKRVIAIAAPFFGSHLAKAVPHKSFHELSPKSLLIKDLNKHKDANKKITTITPEYDNHIKQSVPSTTLKGARNIEVPVRGHHSVIFSKQVEDAIMKELENA